ncbi:hypothetical protein J5N97_010320 [Dioscorea zingiberensis]|uniref:Uncharacterized protein n=1 Tax=Dioscorea zingiberensis TaxID=325984 RepID=A0A9D5HMB0_9LILI|nr:hypothetical protein J5N97_010320 [Dioscorea zingiberensis]
MYKLLFLVDAGLYERKDESGKREEVLGQINQVHGPGADIDTLCVGPSYINREHLRLVVPEGIEMLSLGSIRNWCHSLGAIGEDIVCQWTF